MPKNNSLALPYYFRNIGSQLAILDNLKSARPLILKILHCPPDAIVKANFSPHPQDPVEYYGEWKTAPSAVEKAMTGQYKDLVLWSVVIHNRNLQLQFRDATQRTMAKHAIDGNIIIENCGYLTLEITAEAFKTLETERHLRCEFGDDAAWGKFVDLTEYRERYGVRKLVIYPEATASVFEKIAQH